MAYEKKIVVRAQNEQTLNTIINLYGNINAGVKAILDNYIVLRSNALSDLKGVFSDDELIYLISRQNGLFFDPKFAINKQITIIGIQDYFKMENSDIEDFDNLINKLKNLSSFNIFFLNEFCNLFWTKDIYIKEYIAQLA